ncbi:MAG: substrate-binding domain-containing protein [Treponema sp.]|jgi:simple sugar transport system substrate-binding protein|nr:substrate-binding domain-containing protein [Treponema sp.]
MKKLYGLLLAVVICGSFFACSGNRSGGEASTDSKQYEIVLVVKLEGVAWFDSTRVGMERFNSERADVNAYQIGASTADPAAQVALVNDLIAKGVDAILVIPNDPASLVPAFRNARQAGIKVLTHEAGTQSDADYDVEAFDNTAYGAHMLDVMAEWMGSSGVWQPFVGLLTSPTHNQWVDGEIARAQAAYPGLSTAQDRIEEHEDQQLAYERALELLRAHPDVKALMGSAMSTVPGVSQAITERGLIGRVAAFGTCLPSVAGDYLESGAAQSIHFWVPADAAYATASAAYKLLKGESIADGTDLGVSGYNSVTIRNNDAGVPVIYGQAWVDVNKDNLSEWRNPNGGYKL